MNGVVTMPSPRCYFECVNDERNARNEDAIEQLKEWQSARVPVGVMFQPADESVHCSLCGFVEVTGTVLSVVSPKGRRFGYVEVELSRLSDFRSAPFQQVPIFRDLVDGSNQDLSEHLVLAFSLNSGCTLFIYDVSDVREQKLDSANRRAEEVDLTTSY